MSRLKRSVITTLLIAGTLATSCTQTEYITTPLPEFAPVRPVRPELATVEEDVPIGAILNTVKLTFYANALEQYADAWESFYAGIKAL